MAHIIIVARVLTLIVVQVQPILIKVLTNVVEVSLVVATTMEVATLVALAQIVDIPAVVIPVVEAIPVATAEVALVKEVQS